MAWLKQVCGSQERIVTVESVHEGQIRLILFYRCTEVGQLVEDSLAKRESCQQTWCAFRSLDWHYGNIVSDTLMMQQGRTIFGYILRVKIDSRISNSAGSSTIGSARGRNPLVVDTMNAGSVGSFGFVSPRTSNVNEGVTEPMMLSIGKKRVASRKTFRIKDMKGRWRRNGKMWETLRFCVRGRKQSGHAKHQLIRLCAGGRYEFRPQKQDPS